MTTLISSAWTKAAIPMAVAIAALTALPARGVPGIPSDLDEWIKGEAAKSRAGIALNIAPEGTRLGFVIASPSRQDPNYFFHWTRDSALTMSAVLDDALAAGAGPERDRLLQQLADYVDFTALTQSFDTLSGLRANHFANIGEPKYLADGHGFTGEWGRPQGDGPALQAAVLLRLLGAFPDPQGGPLAPEAAPAVFSRRLREQIRAVIAADLDYLTAHGPETSFDLWEETHGHHFYTRLAQRRALVMGADDARRRGDAAAAERYAQAAAALEAALPAHWDRVAGYLVETRDRDGGCDYKTSNLDSGVVLAALHARGTDGFFAPTDDRVLATAARLAETFAALYPINRVGVDAGGRRMSPAIGRYSEDRYDGGANTGGNPWALITLGMAELDYRVAAELALRGRLRLTSRNRAFFSGLGAFARPLAAGTVLTFRDPRFTRLLAALIDGGDAYLRRVQNHTDPTGELSEQINRVTGQMSSARDLTWSYAAFLTAIKSRQEALSILAEKAR